MFFTSPFSAISSSFLKLFSPTSRFASPRKNPPPKEVPPTRSALSSPFSLALTSRIETPDPILATSMGLSNRDLYEALVLEVWRVS